jgi:H+/Cl- antiporter ClcA
VNGSRIASRSLVLIEQISARRRVLWVVAIGLTAGASARLFLWWLGHAITAFTTHWWLIWLLPVWGLGLGVVIDFTTKGQATASVVAAARGDKAALSPWLAPVALIATVGTHVFGGSVGREGTALQMSGGVTDWLGNRCASPPPRRWSMVVSIAAGFAAVFGVPWAALVLSGEVSRQRLRWIADRTAAAWIAHLVVTGTGYRHVGRAALHISFDIRWVVVGAGVGLIGSLVVRLIRLVATGSHRLTTSTSLRLFAGGAVTTAIGVVTSRANVGLSLGLIDQALAATIASVGVGFVGGEVTPLFVLGALGTASVAALVGLSSVTGASLGLGSLFAAATRTPFTGVALSAELFGWRALPAASMVALGSCLTRPRRGLYDPAATKRPALLTGERGGRQR